MLPRQLLVCGCVTTENSPAELNSTLISFTEVVRWSWILHAS